MMNPQRLTSSRKRAPLRRILGGRCHEPEPRGKPRAAWPPEPVARRCVMTSATLLVEAPWRAPRPALRAFYHTKRDAASLTGRQAWSESAVRRVYAGRSWRKHGHRSRACLAPTTEIVALDVMQRRLGR